jgi:lipopolysaccharide export system protein LptC
MIDSNNLSRWMSRYWLLVPLILAAILIRNWVEDPTTLLPEAPMAISESQADYLLEDFSTRHYDDTGALAYRLEGIRLAHFPDDGRAEITEPEITLTREPATWHVSAEKGLLRRDPNTVTLIGSVRIDRTLANTEGAGQITILASNVAIALDTDELHTDEPVRIESPGMIVEANGLQSSIKAGKLELHSGVSARYEVARPPADTEISR